MLISFSVHLLDLVRLERPWPETSLRFTNFTCLHRIRLQITSYIIRKQSYPQYFPFVPSLPKYTKASPALLPMLLLQAASVTKCRYCLFPITDEGVKLSMYASKRHPCLSHREEIDKLDVASNGNCLPSRHFIRQTDLYAFVEKASNNSRIARCLSL